MGRREIITPGLLIDILGGTAEVARGLGVTAAVVSNWRKRDGVPPQYFLEFRDLMKAKRVRLRVSPLMFGINPGRDG